jgi:hypothetical protein
MPRLPHSLPLSRGQALRLLVTRPQQAELGALFTTLAYHCIPQPQLDCDVVMQ